MLTDLSLLTHLKYLLAAAVVLFLPGLAWQAWAPADERDPLERLADGLGISIGVTTLVGLAGFWLGASFFASAMVGIYAFSLAAWLIGVLRPGWLSRGGWAAAVLGLSGGLLLLAAVAWRMVQARDLLLPAWVDSVHHVLVVKLIELNGAIPATFEPFFPAEFNYHYGFHLLAAIFCVIARTPAELGVLWFGQVINAVVAFSVYRLGRALWRDRRAAVLAALLVAFVFQMPAYYVSWGRYTLLTGLVVLPLAMAAAVELSRQPLRRELAARLVFLTAGVALSHYTTLLLLLVFLLILGAFMLVRRAWRPLLTTAGASLLGGLLALPWLWRSFTALSYQAGLEVVSPLSSDQSGYGQYLLYLIGPNYNYGLYLLALAALVWLLVRGPGRELAAWGLVMGLLMLPWGMRLSPFRPDHMAILIFLPAAVLLGAGLARLADWVFRARPWAGNLALLVTAVGLLVLGLLRTRDVLNPTTVLVNPADMQAIQWVRENTPQDARFFINTAGWQGLYRGVDGGYWLLTLTGRQTVTPPALAWMGSTEYQQQLTAQAELASQAAGCDDAFWQAVESAGLTHVYIREGVGSVQPEGLANCPGVVNEYRRDGVFIYEIAK
ncbi:hypothetical protein LARV_00001 [Longilinea arvoryzae]|uniref:Glycosyltransferase RgtA/B/C/D-like domain-containing protein n=1 Tax=Longilinea arvoryzae TaxID=360412 RepID=A0A0S7B5Y1_9CHLR|nr:DUF6541 family protein [Longilinea arvoryzae]GAP12270.1 hypothetical protein LARV_00001 [Longilinea arvoryzae]